MAPRRTRGGAPHGRSTKPREQSLSPEIFPTTPGTLPNSSDDEADSPGGQNPPPVLVSPIKRRARAAAPSVNKMGDLDVWEMTDNEIISKLHLYLWLIPNSSCI